MTNVRVYVRKNNTATLICPHCGLVKPFSVEKFSQQRRHEIKVRCQCQEVLNLSLDYRQYYRKEVNLPGTYELMGSGGMKSGLIKVINLSMGGAGFVISGLHHLKKNQELLLEFQLNDKKKTVLKKYAVVKSVQQNTIGCQFKDSPEIDKDLGFFLQN